ncbi:MAG TPA: hypothetical protein VFS37_03970 [Conexibacter sp.]|nr:hypothetical protein [Conexibacter sp.]
MGLADVTGVLSRYFVVGFFLPAFFALVALWLTASGGLLPNELEAQSDGVQIAILGVTGLLLGLALSGLNYGLTQLLEGYPLEARRSWPLFGAVYRWMIGRQAAQRRSMVARRDSDVEPDSSLARWQLDRRFPPEEYLLPTSMGNAIRAFESHANSRWGLDGIAVWPRIEQLLSADEREPHVDAKLDFNVFLNGAVGAVAVGLALLADLVVNHPLDAWLSWLYLLPFAVAYASYRQTIGAAIRWGSEMRASVDLRRLDLYERLGVRKPTSFSDERHVADHVNQMLLYGSPLPDELWREEEVTAQR